MKCDEAVERMALAIDGGVSDQEWDRLQAHIQMCQACAQTWLMLQQVDRVLRTAPVVEPPPDFARRAARAAVEANRRCQNLLGGVVLLIGSTLLALLMAATVILARPDFVLVFFAPGGVVQWQRTVRILFEGALLLGRMVWALVGVWQSVLLGPFFWLLVAMMALAGVAWLALVYMAVRLPQRQVVAVRS